MTNKTHLDSNLSQHPVRQAVFNAVTKPIDKQIPLKIKGLGVDTALLREMQICSRGHVKPSTSYQRVLIRVQTKNKHPHSTKKHK